MGIMVYSLLWVMQDLYHQPYWQMPKVTKRGFWSEPPNKEDCNPLGSSDDCLALDSGESQAVWASSI